MTKEQIIEQFPDATEEQISALLTINMSDEDKYRNQIPDPTAQKELEDQAAAYRKLQEEDMTDADKIKKALEDAEASKKEFLRKSNRLDVEKILIGAGLTEEDYKNMIDGIVSEDAEASKTMATNFANLIVKQKEAVRKATEESLMDETKHSGSGGSNPEDAVTDDVAFVNGMNFATFDEEAAKARELY